MAQKTIDIPELPPNLTTDPILEAAARDPRFLRLSDLQRKLPFILFAPDPQWESKQLARLYGAESVEKILTLFQARAASSSADPFQDEVLTYQAYIRRYNRFGGCQSFLHFPDYDVVIQIVGQGSLPTFMGVRLTPAQKQRVHTARILCLTEAELMEDVIGQNPPPEPVSETLSAETLAQIRAHHPPARRKRKKRKR